MTTRLSPFSERRRVGDEVFTLSTTYPSYRMIFCLRDEKTTLYTQTTTRTYYQKEKRICKTVSKDAF